MKLYRRSGIATETADPSHFTGAATTARIPAASDRPAVNIYHVQFERGSRTAWHRHDGVQLLLVTAGRCRVQCAGQPVEEIGAGDIVCVAPGETHWHGASPEAPMTHVAVNIDAATTWLQPVTDEEYAAGP